MSIDDRHGDCGERIFSDPEGLTSDELREQRKRKKKVKHKNKGRRRRRRLAASSRARSGNDGVGVGSFARPLQPRTLGEHDTIGNAILELTERNEPYSDDSSSI